TGALMIGTAGLPHVIVRFFTVPRVRDARLSAGYALVFIAILYTTAPAISAFARTNMINSVSGVSINDLPSWVTNWQATGLITIEDKNQDGRVQYVADAEQNEFIADQDIMVLANPEIARLPNWVIALVAAGGLAAALSTAAGLLLVISTSIAHDLIKKQLKPDISDAGELWAARGAAAVAVIIAGYFGINPPDFVAAVVALAFGLAAASFFPAIIMGIFYKRMNQAGAISGMVTGLLIMILYILKFKFDLLRGGGADDWWLGISPEGFGFVAMLVNFLISMVVCHMTDPPPADVQEMVESIRYPRGAGEAIEH
ncbi:MAG: VC_2705 family sodium/solute symporter, partial [Tunicatimonas sp.]|uniref:VC_2705 family sodium/solute symporter n=1 Tax=Tunicatimonas sp. TaxID=1940096 RepID=UPI003C736006